MNNRLDRSLIIGFFSAYSLTIASIAIRAITIMFVAAVVAKRTTVFMPIGYIESLAWSAGYDLVRGLFVRKSDS